MSGTHIPATLLSRFYDTWAGTHLAIGKNDYWPSFPNNDVNTPLYWFVVVNLVGELSVVAQVQSTSNSEVPAEIQPYVGSDDHFLFFAANAQRGYNVPQGDLYAFLVATGAGKGLARGEQMIEQLGTGSIKFFSYVLCATLSQGDLPGLELFSDVNHTVATLQFMPLEIDGQVRYTAVEVS